MRYIGIDIGKKECSVSFVNEAGKLLSELPIANDKAGWKRLGRRLRPGDRLVLEASTYAYPLHDHFKALGYDVVAAHAKGVRQITESDKKTDKHDSEILAQLLRVNYLPRAYIPEQDVLVLRDLLRARLDLGVSSSQAKNRIRAYLARSGVELPFPEDDLFDKKLGWVRTHRFGDARDAVLAALLLEYDALQAQRTVLEGEIARQAGEDESAKLLMSIPGINYYLAMVILAEAGDIQRFASREAFRAYAGCAPRMRESAGVNRARGMAQGSPRLKLAFSLAEQTATRMDGPIRRAYQNRLEKIGKPIRAHAVARRKVCDLVYAVLTKRETCNWSDASMHELKLTKLNVRIRKAEADGNCRFAPGT
jgi:transposase